MRAGDRCADRGLWRRGRDTEAASIAAEWITNAPTGDGSRITVVEILLWTGAAWAALMLRPAFLNPVASLSTKTGGWFPSRFIGPDAAVLYCPGRIASMRY